jgi:hypothetical protein
MLVRGAAGLLLKKLGDERNGIVAFIEKLLVRYESFYPHACETEDIRVYSCALIRANPAFLFLKKSGDAHQTKGRPSCYGRPCKDHNL